MNAPLDATSSAESEEHDEERGLAWEPFTPAGVVAFARAPFSRLWLIQTLVALGAATAVAWFLIAGWFPVIEQAIQQLPPSGAIDHGSLAWFGAPEMRLAENRCLSLDVDLRHGGGMRSVSHLQIEFGSDTVRLYSLAGSLDVAYPRGYVIAFNRTELEPLWGAWSPWLAVGAAGSMLAGLLIVWAGFSILYVAPVFLAGFFMNRDLGIIASLKVAGAAQMPGAVLLTLAIAGYTLGFVDLPRLGAVFVAHFLITWIYLVIAPAFARRLTSVGVADNPFKGR